MAIKTNTLETTRTVEELALTSKISVDISDAIIDIKNIVFSEPFTLTGNYTFGLIKTNPEDSITIDAGTTLYDMFVSAFCGNIQYEDPVISKDPAINLVVNGFNNKKVGDNISPSYTITFTDGEYKSTFNGDEIPQPANVKISSCTVKLLSGDAELCSITHSNDTLEDLTTLTGTFDNIDIIDTQTLTINVELEHTAGEYAKKYNEELTEIRFEAGSLTAEVEYTPKQPVTTYNYYVKSIATNTMSEDEVTEFLQNNTASTLNEKFDEKYTNIASGTYPANDLVNIEYIILYVSSDKNISKITFNSEALNIDYTSEYNTTDGKYKCFISGFQTPVTINKNTINIS